MVDLGSRTVAQVLGEITWLLSQAASHKHLTLADLEWAVMPPVLLNQFHISYKDKQPIAFATWARLSEVRENAIIAEAEATQLVRLAPKDWRSGDRLWLIDLVCPFATSENKLFDLLRDDLAKNRFKGKPVRHVKRNPKTGVVEMEMKGVGDG